MFSRLHLYTVHIHPGKAAPYERAEFVHEGFSWGAFIFMAFFALYNRLWVQAAIIFFVNALIFALYRNDFCSPETAAILNLGFQLYVGFAANDWLRARLKQQGYILADLVSGENSLRAEQRFFDRFSSEYQLSPT